MRIGKAGTYSDHALVPKPDLSDFITLYRYSPDGKVYYKTSAGTSHLVGGSAGPSKIYNATIEQSGTNHPVATILENTLGADPVLLRTSGGNYTVTLAGAFTPNKTQVLIGGFSPSGAGYSSIVNTQSNEIKIFTEVRATGTPIDDQMKGATLEIRVWD